MKFEGLRLNVLNHDFNKIYKISKMKNNVVNMKNTHESPQLPHSAKRLIRFDWAIKRLLRNKANYSVLEGFLCVLLNEKVKIVNISDPEGNKDNPEGKYNRVDILVENDKKDLLIVEVQNSMEADYFYRMLFGVSKVIIDHIQMGEKYVQVRKVYHINIVYFELGQGIDYVYHGTTEFRGIHHQDILELNENQKKLFLKRYVSELYPEYYILCVNKFNDIATDSLDQWIYFLKNDAIPREFTAQGLTEAREVLQYDALSGEDKKEYERHVRQKVFEENVLWSNRQEGHFEGHQEGLAEGLEQGRVEGREEGMAEGIEKGLAERKQLEEMLKAAQAVIAEKEAALTKTQV
ncbi:hypothetical protein FACS1894121_0290 [Bacteroidia bacterium]|nr:hypothetical protein FACS1894121_0290 [Bacteroidia bacterium]